MRSDDLVSEHFAQESVISESFPRMVEEESRDIDRSSEASSVKRRHIGDTLDYRYLPAIR